MFQIDSASRIPIYEQLISSVLTLTAAGVLKPDEKLPPVRVLAAELGINPNTVAKAYRELEAQGYIYSTVGRGSFISDKLVGGTEKRRKLTDEVRKAAEKARANGVTESELKTIIEDVYKGAKS